MYIYYMYIYKYIYIYEICMMFIADVLADVSFLYGACIAYRKYLLLSDDHRTVVIMGILINQKAP